jgi:hypothetical protein
VCGMLIKISLQPFFDLHKTPTTSCGNEMAFRRPVLQSHSSDDKL